MKNFIFLFVASVFMVIDASAQKGIDAGTPYGSGDDSVRCAYNINLFVPHAKNKNYEEAYPFWKEAYEECPASTINIYIKGVAILNWQLSRETDPAKREEVINAILKLYDDRIKYFGSAPRNRRDWKDAVVWSKADTYNKLKGENTDHQLIYKWLGDVIDEFQEKTFLSAIMLYMVSSIKLLQNDMDNHKENYVNDFLKCSALLDAQLTAAQAASEEKEIEDLLSCKKEIESNFAASGAADCDILQTIYAPKVEDNKANLEFLKETMTLLRRLGCNESDVYISASEYAYKIEPTAESAMGLGMKAFKNKDDATAEKYLNEAIAMTEDAETKADLYFALAGIAMQKNQYQNVKQLSLKCLAENPNYGRAYILIASVYALGGRSLFPDDPVLNKLIWYAVVDKFERARQVDPSVANEANRQINNYRQHFPTKEEIFMHPLLKEGENFTLPGWINEVVRIR